MFSCDADSQVFDMESSKLLNISERESLTASAYEALGILEKIAQIRGCLVKGSGYDYKKAANLLLEDYRSGRLGRITLEMPPFEEREGK